MSVTSRKRLTVKLKNKEYREGYVESHVKMGLPTQIRAIREQRGWTQEQLGAKSGMKQNVLSRLESEAYGNLTINTLLRLAAAFDVGLLVRFIAFSKLAQEMDDYSVAVLVPPEFAADEPALSAWAEQTASDEVLNSSLVLETSAHEATFELTPQSRDLTLVTSAPVESVYIGSTSAVSSSPCEKWTLAVRYLCARNKFGKIKS